VDEAAQALNTAMAHLRQVALGFTASVDTHPQGGDVKQAPSLMSGAVGEAETPNPNPDGDKG
jgi:hypothetical protein